MTQSNSYQFMHGHALQQLNHKYIDLNIPGYSQPQPFQGKAKGVIAGIWLASIVALASVLTPAPAQAADGYHLSGTISVDGQRIARPDDRVEADSESYVIMQSSEYTVRLTYRIQSAGDNLVDARFLIERQHDDSWQTLMQPSVQAVLGQQSSVSLEAPEDSDEVDVEFVFTITEDN